MTQQSPERWPRAFACSAVVPSQGGAGAAVRSVDRFQIRWFSVVGGAAGAGTWGQVSSGTFRWVRGTWGGAMDGDVATRQERQRSVEKCWSRGRIVSALLSAAQGGCLPSMEPPNPVAATMVPAKGASKDCSTSDTGLHLGQWGFMKGASPEVLRAYRCCIDQAGGGFLKPSFSRREQEPHRPTTTGQKAYVVIEGRPGSQPGPFLPRESGQGSPEPVRTTEVRVIALVAQQPSELGGAARTSSRSSRERYASSVSRVFNLRAA